MILATLLQHLLGSGLANPFGEAATPLAQGSLPEGAQTIMVIVALVGLVVGILFLVSLYKCLDRVRPSNREMSPGQVFLNLIPLFNLFWIFYTVIKLADSLVAEAAHRQLDFGDGAKGIGIGYAACVVLSIIPVVGILAGIIGLVLFIVYWVKVAGFSSQLEATPVPESQ